MGVVIMGLTVAFAWLFALLGWDAPGADASDSFATSAMRWMMFLPIGIQFLVSAFMHTVLAKKTAAMIGWHTNGFQYEIGFASLGIGIAGIVSCYLGPDAWLPLAIVVSVFLLGAAAHHIVETVREKNFNPVKPLLLLYDIALPVPRWALLIVGGVSSLAGKQNREGRRAGRVAVSAVERAVSATGGCDRATGHRQGDCPAGRGGRTQPRTAHRAGRCPDQRPRGHSWVHRADVAVPGSAAVLRRRGGLDAASLDRMSVRPFTTRRTRRLGTPVLVYSGVWTLLRVTAALVLMALGTDDETWRLQGGSRRSSCGSRGSTQLRRQPPR